MMLFSQLIYNPEVYLPFLLLRLIKKEKSRSDPYNVDGARQHIDIGAVTEDKEIVLS
jgi:hypothetical protein